MMDEQIKRMMDKSETITLEDGTVSYFYRTAASLKLRRDLRDYAQAQNAHYRDGSTECNYSWQEGDLHFSLTLGALLTNIDRVKLTVDDYTAPASSAREMRAEIEAENEKISREAAAKRALDQTPESVKGTLLKSLEYIGQLSHENKTLQAEKETLITELEALKTRYAHVLRTALSKDQVELLGILASEGTVSVSELYFRLELTSDLKEMLVDELVLNDLIEADPSIEATSYKLTQYGRIVAYQSFNRLLMKNGQARIYAEHDVKFTFHADHFEADNVKVLLNSGDRHSFRVVKGSGKFRFQRSSAALPENMREYPLTDFRIFYAENEG